MPESRRETKSRILTWICIAVLTGLCLTQYLGISALNIFFTGCVGCCMLLSGTPEDAALLLFISLPMFNLFNANIGSTSMYYLFIIVFWFKYFRYYKWNFNRAKLLVLLGFLAIRLTAGDIAATAKWFLLFSVLVLTYKEECMAGRQLRKIVFYLSITFIIASLFGYMMLIGGRSIYLRGHIYNNGVTTIRFAGLIGDSVFFSQFCALLVGANLTLGCYHKRYLPAGVLLSGIITYFCLLSYSKTGLLIIIAEVIVYVFWLLWKSPKTKSALLFSLFCTVAFGAAVLFFVNYLLAGRTSRFIQNYLIRFASSDLLTGRLDVWNHYIDLMLSSWRTLFIAMPQSVYGANFTLYRGHTLNRAHNILIETICAFGCIATLFILIWLAFLMADSIRKHDGLLNLIPIGIILSSGMMLHGHFDFHYYFIVAIAVAFLCRKNKGTCRSEAERGGRNG